MSETTLIGFDDLDKKLRNPTWVSKPLGRMFDKWRFSTQHDAVANIKRGPGGWIDTGKTRQSITSERDDSAFPQFARVGSNLMTARWGEYGTGLLSEDPASSHQRYFPPPSALAVWAAKHNMNPFLLARSIYLKGGTAPRRFLRDAAKASEAKLPGWLQEMARDVEMEASKA